MPIIAGTAPHKCETRPAVTGRVLECQLGGDIGFNITIYPPPSTTTLGSSQGNALLGPILRRHWFRHGEHWGVYRMIPAMVIET